MIYRSGSLPLLCALIISIALHGLFLLRAPTTSIAFTPPSSAPIALTLGEPPQIKPEVLKEIDTIITSKARQSDFIAPPIKEDIEVVPATIKPVGEAMEQVVVREAKFRSQPIAPQYPDKARRAKQEGLVLVRAQVDSNGLTKAVKVARSSGFPMLDQAALEAVSKWDFVPAQQNEERITAWIEVPIDFKLR